MKVTDAKRAALNADLYLALENPVCECARMADIALDAQCADKDYVVFALGKLCEMVLSLREIYYGREAGPIKGKEFGGKSAGAVRRSTPVHADRAEVLDLLAPIGLARDSPLI